MCMRIFLMRIGKYTEAVKSHFGYPFEHLSVIFFALAGISRNQGCSNSNTRSLLADSSDKLCGFFACNSTAHRFKHTRRCVLQWNIQIVADIWFTTHYINYIHGEPAWESVMQTNPFDTFHL